MSDFSINQYEDKSDKENKNAQDPFSGFLTKSQHRNPEIHVLGDNLPNEILAYQAGSATLQPDVGGNTPLLLRSSQEIIGSSGANQNLNTVTTTIATLTGSVTCPLQASGTPFVYVSYYLTMLSNATGGGVGNYCSLSIYSNGVQVPGSSWYLERSFFTGTNHHPVGISRKKVPINPGQTINIDIRGFQIEPGGFATQYAAQPLNDRSALNLELYY